jgi:hypothetical protein
MPLPTAPLLAVLWPLALSPARAAPTPRAPLPAPELRVAPLPAGVDAAHHRLVIKVQDGLRGRALPDGRLQLSGADAGPVQAVLDAHGAALRPLIQLPEATLAGLEARALQRSKRAQPDLAGMLVVEVPRGADLLGLGHALLGRPELEYAHIELVLPPPPGDLPPTTGDLSGEQGYAGPDPGIGALEARALGATGAGVRLSDCEYGWEVDHEDLMDRVITMEPGQTPMPEVASYGWDDHGTAVLGETSAVDNGYGVTGLAPDADVAVFPEWTVEEGGRRTTAIAAALAASLPGDVVLLEMQAGGCDGRYAPAEVDPNVWTVVRAGVDAGVVVVGAAGNGAANLDGGCYAADYGTWGDSGAILVGAGSADTDHDQLSYSTYGARVDLQGWGESVATLGYSNWLGFPDPTRQTYTDSFSGTSSASPIVASAAVLVQGYALAAGAPPLAPEALRELLIDTGTPQGSGPHIGPLPDVPAALRALDADLDGALHPDWGGDDCDDAEPLATPGRAEVWYDGVDGDCLGGDDFDADGDGHAAAAGGGADCDDADPAVSPDAEDAPYDGLDADCGGGSDFDVDGDGVDHPDDCDDADPAVAPGVSEDPDNGVDDDCDGEVDEAADPEPIDDGGDGADGGGGAGGGAKGGCAVAGGGAGSGLLGAFALFMGILGRRARRGSPR